MILTATPSPSIDWTVSVSGFAFGAINRADDEHREPSGKGINVSIATRRNGHPTHAILPGSGDGATYIVDALDREGVSTSLTPGGPVRTNITLLTDEHPDTKINTDNASLTDDMIEAMDAAVRTRADASSVFLSAGSLPRGTDPGVHARLVRAARAQGAYTVVDSSGAALRGALEAAPDLLKPNISELSELTGTALTTFGDVISAAATLRARGIGAVLVSMGGDGAILIDDGEPLWARARPRVVRNAVGAGDALLAGFLSARADRRDALATAVRWGASAVEHTTTLFTVAPEHAITAHLIDDPDPAQPVREAA